MGWFDLLWEAVFFIGAIGIIFLCSKAKKIKRTKSSKLPFNIVIIITVIIMALRLITWFI